MNFIADAIAEQTGDPGLFPAILEMANYSDNLEEDYYGML